MWTPAYICDELGRNMVPWRQYAIDYPLKAMHEALDPAFRRTIVQYEDRQILSAVLVILGSGDRIPMWTMYFGLYAKKPGFDIQTIAQRPAMQVSAWPGEIKETVARAGGALIMQVGGQGPARVDYLKWGIRVTRPLTGMEAHWAIERSKNRHPLLARP